jgi:hypothetical protein
LQSLGGERRENLFIIIAGPPVFFDLFPEFSK